MSRSIAIAPVRKVRVGVSRVSSGVMMGYRHDSFLWLIQTRDATPLCQRVVRVRCIAQGPGLGIGLTKPALSPELLPPSAR